MSKDHLKVQKVKKHQNHTPTNNWVLWLISKVTKIRDQGVDLGFFALRFEICICGVGLEIKKGFLFF